MELFIPGCIHFSFPKISEYLLGKKWVFINFLNYINPNSYLDNKMLIVHRKEFKQLRNLNIIAYEHGVFIAVKINHFSTSSC